MTQGNLIDIFDCEVQCEYRNRTYKVRDNGAICRLPKHGCRSSVKDNVWSFGTKNTTSGYMIFTGNIRVHQVVCTAFHGPAPHSNMVVDHMDTNRCNNRPENLRWLTRLENALMNEITRKKIIYLCGSIEKFIEDPSILRNKVTTPDINWMRTVTKEEAANCKKYFEEWDAKDSKTKGGGNGIKEWIFMQNLMKSNRENIISEKTNKEDKPVLKDSLTPGAKQENWKTPTESLLTPKALSSQPLADYLSKLQKGSLFTKNKWGESYIYDAAMAEDKSHLSVISRISGTIDFALAEVTFADGCFIHKNIRSFFSEKGVQKYFTISLGQEWTGGDVLEDYC